MSAPHSFSRDELQARLGEEVAVSDWIAIDQATIDTFAALTGDQQWIHVDVERARHESPYGAPIAHGFLVLALIPQLAQQTYRIEGLRAALNYGLDRVRFISPVVVGSELRAHFVPQQFTPIDGGCQVTWTVTLELRNAPKPACVAQVVARWLF